MTRLLTVSPVPSMPRRMASNLTGNQAVPFWAKDPSVGRVTIRYIHACFKHRAFQLSFLLDIVCQAGRSWPRGGRWAS